MPLAMENRVAISEVYIFVCQGKVKILLANILDAVRKSFAYMAATMRLLYHDDTNNLVSFRPDAVVSKLSNSMSRGLSFKNGLDSLPPYIRTYVVVGIRE